MSEVIDALTAIWNKSESQKDKKMPSRGKEREWAIWGQTGLKTDTTRKKQKTKGKREKANEGQKKRREKMAREILVL